MPVLDRTGFGIEQLIADVGSCQKHVGAKPFQIQTEPPKLGINGRNLVEQQSRTTHNSQASDENQQHEDSKTAGEQYRTALIHR